MGKNVTRKILALLLLAVTAAIFTGCWSEIKNLAAGGGKTPLAQTPQTVAFEEQRIPSTDAGIELYLRHKSVKGEPPLKNQDVILFLEPFGVPTAEAFDVPGYSWMEECAQKGYDTWAMDFRGFGRSTRPVQMDKPPAENPPVIRATDAVKDLEAAVEFIKKSRQVEKINLIGWSWGSVVASMYAIAHPETVKNLVLYGSMHGFNLPSMAQLFEAKDKPGELNPNLPAYQVVTPDATLHHWHMMISGKDLVSDAAMSAVEKVILASDPASQTRQPPSVRRPMGPLVDLYYIWTNRPIFDAAKIQDPVLIIRGDADFFADPTFINKVTGTSRKKEVVIPDATHWALYEKNRAQLIDETEKFLRSE